MDVHLVLYFFILLQSLAKLIPNNSFAPPFGVGALWEILDPTMLTIKCELVPINHLYGTMVHDFE